jgi:hypothetical protein
MSRSRWLKDVKQHNISCYGDIVSILSLKQLRPENLPLGVTAARGYDHRGHCLVFEHETLGALGKIVLSKIRDGKMLIQAELYKGHGNVESPLVQKKTQVFEQVVAIVNNRFDENFPV